MFKPKLVLFDFGGTLIEDGDFQLYAGLDQLRLAADNPEVTTTEVMCDLWHSIEDRLIRREKTEYGYVLDVQLSGALRIIFTLTGLQYSIDIAQCEIIFDRFNAERKPTPYMAELLNALDAAGIRTAVISNTVLSGEAMATAINDRLPNNKMEFILTSADYLFCKPASDMFAVAAKRAGVEPNECWYLGDSFGPDVIGGHSVGMLPVLYESELDTPFERKELKGKTYYVVNSWAELISRIPEDWS